MKAAHEIIMARGGYEHLKTNPIRIKVEGFMPLSIEYLGKGHQGGDVISVMHWYVQNGDLMRDPDLVFEILPDNGYWLPLSYRQDSLGMMQEAVRVDDETGKLLVKPKLVKELVAFSREWSSNLIEQQFVEAARR